MNYINCIDASTDYCPCKLSEVEECIICSQLGGENFCDCVNYNGTCIYQEFVWNKCVSKQVRDFKIYTIESRTFIREDVLQLKIKLNKTMCRELNNLGAFVFLRKPGDPESLGVPISVVASEVDEELITVIIKKIGVKSKCIFDCENQILVKGPYWNGIQGQLNLKELKNDNCIVVGRGVALAPLVLAAKKLDERNNNIVAILDIGRGPKSYFSNYFRELNCEVVDTVLIDQNNELTENGKNTIINYIKSNNVSTVLSGGNDNFHRAIIQFLHKFNPSLKFSTVNNATMCCGEGTCGSCVVDTKEGAIRACKEQYNPINIFGGGA